MKDFDAAYKLWLNELERKIRTTQMKASLVVNAELVAFYWDLGQMIEEKEKVYGGKLIEQVAKDLHGKFPGMKGLSRSNMFYCKKFYQFYDKANVQQLVEHFADVSRKVTQVSENHKVEKVQQAVGLLGELLLTKIPWGHNILIFTKAKDEEEVKRISELAK